MKLKAVVAVLAVALLGVANTEEVDTWFRAERCGDIE